MSDTETVAPPKNANTTVGFDWVRITQARNSAHDIYFKSKQTVTDRLETLFTEHLEKGLLRSGVTLRVGVEIFEEEAGKLISSLVREVSQFAQDAKAYAAIADVVHEFLSFLDGELENIVEKVQFEIQDMGSSKGFCQAAQRHWAVKRATIEAGFEQFRPAFPGLIQMDQEPSPAAEPLLDQDETNEPALPISRDWHEMWANIAIAIHTGKLVPSSETEILDAMSAWSGAKGVNLDETSLHDCARMLWLNIRKLDRVISSLPYCSKPDGQSSAEISFGWSAGRGRAELSSRYDPETAVMAVEATRSDSNASDAKSERNWLIASGCERETALRAPALDYDNAR
ncbi:MAG: hypothetical protein KDE55_02935 [Novosphingobium sp.]|nr:hypothetical protein [Novosphingobium sp.]